MQLLWNWKPKYKKYKTVQKIFHMDALYGGPRFKSYLKMSNSLSVVQLSYYEIENQHRQNIKIINSAKIVCIGFFL